MDMIKVALSGIYPLNKLRPILNQVETIASVDKTWHPGA